MTLHEAIEFLLIEAKGELTSSELAQLINEKKLYERRDLQPVTSNQILARIGNYKDLFDLKGSKVTLKNVHERDLVDEEIKQLFWSFINQLKRNTSSFDEEKVLSFILVAIAEIDSNDGNTGQLKSFFKNITSKSRFGKFINFYQPDLLELTVKFLFSVQRYPRRNLIIQRIIYWIQETNKFSRLNVFPDYLCSIIGGIDLFEKNVILSTTQNMLNNYKLNIFDNNLETNFIHSFNPVWVNEDVVQLNGFMLTASGSVSSILNNESEPQFVGIYTPPWGSRLSSSEWSDNFAEIMSEVSAHEDISLDKALLIVPENALYSGGKDLKARMELTNSNYLDSVITLPYHSKNTGLKSVVILLFDFKKNVDTDQVFFADFNQMSDFDIEKEWSTVTSFLNNKELVDGVSIMVTPETIDKYGFTWLPSKFLFQNNEIELEPHHELVPIIDLLLSSKRGGNIDRKKLYEGGEIKYIRSSDLSEKDTFLTINQSMLGMDSDELERKPLLTKNNVIVVLIGGQLKPTVLPDNELLLFNSNIALLEVNITKALPEFLVYELRKEYVSNQMTIIRNGVTVPFVTLSDFRKLKIQVPPLEIQKDILLKINRDRNEFVHNHSVSEDSSKIILHNYLGIIKHTMKQPLATLSEDIKNISAYLARKSNEKSVDLDDFIVDLLPGESEAENEESRVQKTLDRLARAISDAHWRFEQSEKLLKIETAEINLKRYEVLEVLKEQVKNYSGIQFSVKGKKSSTLLDINLWSILMDNLIDNAKKHGFIDQKDCRVLFEISTQQRVDGSDEIVIAYYNNGKPLPRNFDSDQFVTNGTSSNKNAGDGFGGYLINNILKKHYARIEVVPSKELLLNDYNVCFKIYLNAI